MSAPMSKNSDILENEIVSFDAELLPILLIDRSRTEKLGNVHNIMWATDNYVAKGDGYQEWDEINAAAISGEHGFVLQPRVNKSKEEQEHRSRDKAEVFTAAWICNKQNNLIDAAWFGTEEAPFNSETEKGWETKSAPITFPEGKTWQDYVKDTRLEMACGEAPYLVSRYNVVTGEEIAVPDRIGILDRKLRVVSENTSDEKDWLNWTVIAYQSTYGFEWQGDNLVLAREAMIYTFFDYFKRQFGKIPTKVNTRKIANIVSWNLWQMDGLKGVIPGSCHDDVQEEMSLFGDCTKTVIPCKGCQSDDITKHNGIYCQIKDWETGKTVRFIDLLNK